MFITADSRALALTSLLAWLFVVGLFVTTCGPPGL